MQAITSFSNEGAVGLDKKTHIEWRRKYVFESNNSLYVNYPERKSSNIRSVYPYLYGGFLTDTQKKCGGIHPTVVANKWRRIAAKVACKRLVPGLRNLFSPHQLGVLIKNGIEAGSHAAPIYYTTKCDSAKALLKADCENAFNVLQRDKLLDKVHSTILEIYKLMEQLYRYPSNVYYGGDTIMSQQEDSLAPAHFCLGIQDIISPLNIDLNIW